MAREAISEWGKAIDRVLDENADTGDGPATIYAFTRALAAEPNSPSAASWKREVGRVRAGERGVTEARARAYARALGVERSVLPAATETPTARELDARLATLEDEAVRAVDFARLCESMKAAIRLLAGGDTEGALRALPAGAEPERTRRSEPRAPRRRSDPAA